MQHSVVVYVHCGLSSELLQELSGECSESLCIVASIEDVLEHKLNLLANAPDHSNRHSTVSGYVHDLRILSEPHPIRDLPLMKCPHFYIYQVLLHVLPCVIYLLASN